MPARLISVGGTEWFKDGDDEVRLKDLGPHEVDEWLIATDVDANDLPGRTIHRSLMVTVPGQYGGHPCRVLVFEDGRTASFVLPRDDED